MRNDITAQDILAQLGLTNKPIIEDNAIEIEVDNNIAEIYSNSEWNKKKNMNMKKNTFQQSSVNVRGQAPTFSASPAQAPEMKEDQEIPEDRGIPAEPINDLKYGRKLNWQNDNIVEIRLQIGKIKEGNRYHRASAYLSIKTENDKRYMIFMRSSLTTAVDETFRGIKKDGDTLLHSVAEELYIDHRNDDLFFGRVMYKVTKGQKIQKHHREKLPQTMLALWVEDNTFYARFHLVGTDYDFALTEQLSNTQQQYYTAEGVWQSETNTMTMEEAFNG